MLANAAVAVKQNREESANAKECRGARGSDLNITGVIIKSELGSISARKNLSNGESQSEQELTEKPETRAHED
jgi:hypothetical protein